MDAFFSALGVVAGVIGAAGWVPQVVRTFRRKSVEDISPWFLAQVMSSLLSYTLYGLYFSLWALVSGVLCQVACVSVMIVLRVRYRGRTAPATQR